MSDRELTHRMLVEEDLEKGGQGCSRKEKYLLKEDRNQNKGKEEGGMEEGPCVRRTAEELSHVCKSGESTNNQDQKRGERALPTWGDAWKDYKKYCETRRKLRKERRMTIEGICMHDKLERTLQLSKREDIGERGETQSGGGSFLKKRNLIVSRGR